MTDSHPTGEVEKRNVLHGLRMRGGEQFRGEKRNFRVQSNLMKYFLLLSAFVLLAVACTKDDDDPSANGNGQPCDNNEVTFTLRIEPIISTHCRGCHNNAISNGGQRLVTYEQISEIANNGALMHSVNGTGGFSQMPPNGSLSNCDKEALQLWVDAGAPND